jgi:hypothetical protein
MELSEQISEALTGSLSATIKMNDKYYSIKAPKTKLVAKILNPLSHITMAGITEENFLPEGLKKSVEQYGYADEVIALAISGDSTFRPLSKLRLWRLRQKLSLASDKERGEALKEIMKLIVPSDFFSYARLAMELTGTMIRKQE